MASSSSSLPSSNSIPLEALRAYHAEERRLFSRMVLTMVMDPTRAMEIVAFWLWLEEVGHPNIIARMNTFDDRVIQLIATMANIFIEALRLEFPDLGTPVQSSLELHPYHDFKQTAAHGITYYLNSVCYRAFDDIRNMADEANNRGMEFIVHQLSRTNLDFGNVQGADPLGMVSRGDGQIRISGRGSGSGRGRERGRGRGRMGLNHALLPSDGSIIPYGEGIGIQEASAAGLQHDLPFGPYGEGSSRMGENANRAISPPYVPHGEGTSSGITRRGPIVNSQSMPIMNGDWVPPYILEMQRVIQFGYHLNLLLGSGLTIPQMLFGGGMGNPPMLEDALEHTGGEVNQAMFFGSNLVGGEVNQAMFFGSNLVGADASQPQRMRSNLSMNPSAHSSTRRSREVPRDERTLFVTFSNGYPLTEQELYDFFMRFARDVELVTIPEVKSGVPPLFARVAFYSLATVLSILNGNKKAKFMIKGRHLWARRYIPRKQGRDVEEEEQ